LDEYERLMRENREDLAGFVGNDFEINLLKQFKESQGQSKEEFKQGDKESITAPQLSSDQEFKEGSGAISGIRSGELGSQQEIKDDSELVKDKGQIDIGKGLDEGFSKDAELGRDLEGGSQ
jgi:hypothetical protein